jgi:hypothetical protein
MNNFKGSDIIIGWVDDQTGKGYLKVTKMIPKFSF